MITGERCYVKPLLPLLHGDGSFYVLALSQNNVRLLQCTRYSYKLITPVDIPRNIAEALKYDEPQKQHQFHTTGRGPAIFHGQGVSKDYDKINILRYFQQVNHGLHSSLREEKAPLVLIAVDYLHPIYREANTYVHFVDEGVTGNPDELSETELQQQAWVIVEPLFKQAQARALSDYKLAEGKGLAIRDVKQAVLSAFDGRISILMVAADLQQWGSFDINTRKVHLYEEARPGTEDLLETATINTFLKGGDVYALPSENIPSGTTVAGILRY
jgi:hypothetical protein